MVVETIEWNGHTFEYEGRGNNWSVTDNGTEILFETNSFIGDVVESGINVRCITWDWSKMDPLQPYPVDISLRASRGAITGGSFAIFTQANGVDAQGPGLLVANAFRGRQFHQWDITQLQGITNNQVTMEASQDGGPPSLNQGSITKAFMGFQLLSQTGDTGKAQVIISGLPILVGGPPPPPPGGGDNNFLIWAAIVAAAVIATSKK